MEKNNKLKPEERAEELISRFTKHGVDYNTSIYCALELILEIYYQLLHHSYYNSYREQYWRDVEKILKDKLL